MQNRKQSRNTLFTLYVKPPGYKRFGALSKDLQYFRVAKNEMLLIDDFNNACYRAREIAYEIRGMVQVRNRSGKVYYEANYKETMAEFLGKKLLPPLNERR